MLWLKFIKNCVSFLLIEALIFYDQENFMWHMRSPYLNIWTQTYTHMKLVNVSVSLTVAQMLWTIDVQANSHLFILLTARKWHRLSNGQPAGIISIKGFPPGWWGEEKLFSHNRKVWSTIISTVHIAHYYIYTVLYTRQQAAQMCK